MVMGRVPLARILDTGRFDFERAAQAPGWLRSCAASMSGNRGIRHRLQRLPRAPSVSSAALPGLFERPWDNGRLLRSKGFFWLASRYREAGSWSQAGGLMRHGLAGRWWRFVPREHWPQDEDGLRR
jgi:G3E family GTPase